VKPFKDLLVVSIEQAVAAPLCTSRLVDAGARDIKVERAEGDFARKYDTAAKGESSYFAWLNQGKESLCLNFKDKTDADLLWAIIKKADVLLQNLSPGALARSGFSTAELHKSNPALIICNISGYGDHGPVSEKRAYDLLVQAESGLISVSGDINAPGRIGVSICDIGAGLTAYTAILEALINRAQTGEGEELSVSLFGVAAEWMSVPYVHALFGAGAPEPCGLHHPSIAPYGAFQCSDDRLVLISIQNEREWERLCKQVLNSNAIFENKDYLSNDARVDNRDKLEAEINALTTKMTSDEFQERLQSAAIAYGAINSAADLASHPAFRGRTIATANNQEMTMPAHPVASGKASNQCVTGTPSIGQHSDSIRSEFTDRSH